MAETSDLEGFFCLVSAMICMATVIHPSLLIQLMTATDSLPVPTAIAVQARLTALRSRLTQHHLDAYLIPSADEHLNEYLPAVKQRRQWISGFTGSAGDLLVGREQAWLFVDPRYYEQADQEVDSSLMQVSKVGLEEHKTLEATLEALGKDASQQGRHFRLGFDPFTVAVSQFHTLEKQLKPWDVELVPVGGNWVDQVKSESVGAAENGASDYASSTVFAVPDALTGETVEQKLQRVRQEMQQSNADLLPVTKLDQVAWLFNLRGWDVAYNPVFIAYAVVTARSALLFTNRSRIPAEIQKKLLRWVTFLPYEQYGETLRSLLLQKPGSRILIDPKQTTMGTRQLFQDLLDTKNCAIVEATHPIEQLKACKNDVEVAQMQQANLKASRAKTRTLKWIMEQLDQGATLTEADVAATVERFYAEESDFQGLSFNTIAGSGANSSIVHYGTPNPQVTLKSGDLLLLDSGAQYAAGTTDDTRTIAIGTPTSEQIERYTEVLKAHINCAMQRFPKGTTGAQLDGITRATLWHAGLDYGHGTGHGVGAFLNVHEGPNGISKRVSEPLEPGMVTSVEPGYYEPGWGGIRIENLYVVRDLTPPEEQADSEANGKSAKTIWYGLESLTYIPFDARLIDLNRLDARQRQWLDAYNQAIADKLAPSLSPEDATWLRSQRKIGMTRF